MIRMQRSLLSAAEKAIIIIGAGSGIGRETARSFTTAGASHVAVLGHPQVNVKGPFLALKAFVPTANSLHATVLASTSGMTPIAAKYLPSISGYITSKFAQAKMMFFLPLDQPHIFTAFVHPGMVETAILAKAGGDAMHLPAHFLVWLSSPEAAYLNGRTVWANEGVEELKT
ncbi:hypothetical protein GGR53DRAFT_466817 [Hypoxylon sp. FL1150]|nr:hypothetical protein GGR53DRAFT_466817 [Hypoxylon sp. FL1150]